MDILQSERRNETPTLPSLPPKYTSLSCVSEASSIGSGSISISSRLRKNSAKLRRCQRNNAVSSPLPSAKSLRSNVSSRRTTCHLAPILTEKEYEERKERLLKSCKLKKDLEAYWDVDTPSRMERRRKEEEPSDDSDYDTDLDQELVGLELIVDEKTKQIKDDGCFPEYKQKCRKLNVVPNHYFIRHSVDEGIVMKHRYLSPGDCSAMGSEMRDNLTFSSIDLEDNGIDKRHLLAMSDMLQKNKYVADINFSDNPIGVNGAAIMKNILSNNSHIVKVDVSGSKLGEIGGKYCARILECNKHIRELNIGKNGIGDSAALEIGKAMESNSTLESLDVSWNNISRFGACALAMGLKHNTQLKTFNASMNGFERVGGIAIMEMLRTNRSLTSLDLSVNRINDDITEVFARVVPNNKSLETIKLSFNTISSDGAIKMLKPLTSMMKKNKCLKLIELDGTDVPTELALLIEKLRDKRGIIVSIRIPPSRREKTLDPLTGGLMSIISFTDQEDIDLMQLFPRSYEDKGAMISCDDVLELIKHSGKEVNKGKIHELRRKLVECKDRRFELSELMDVYKHMKNERDPYREHPLRTKFAGKRRGIPTDATQRPATQTGGVRFIAED